MHSKAKKPNIIWVLTDEQNTLTMSLYDDDNFKHLGVSPNLDRMAYEGVLFKQHHIQCPQCVASRAAMLTGLYPHQNGVINNNAYFGNWPYEDTITLPEVFAQNGYEVANIGKMHYSKGKEIWGCADEHYQYYVRNYLHHDGLRGKFRGQEEQYEILYVPELKAKIALSGIYPEPENGDEYAEAALISKAINWIDERKVGNRPFMLRLSIQSPHAPFLAPREHYNMYSDEDMKDFWWDTVKERSELPVFERRGKENPNKEDTLRINRTYYGLATHVDDEIGRLDAYLKENRLYENTVLIFTSDHGHLNGEYSQYGKGQFYDLITRVPTFIKGVGVEKGKVCERFTESVDFGVTMLHLAGLEAPDQFKISGIDMLNPERERTEVIGEIILAGVRRSWIRNEKYSLDFNLMNFKGKEDIFDVCDDESERILALDIEDSDGKLIDLENDPREVNNLFFEPNYKTVRDELVARLKERLSERKRPIKNFKGKA